MNEYRSKRGDTERLHMTHDERCALARATGPVSLNWRARHCSIGAKDATITMLRAQRDATSFARIESNTCVSRHGFDRLMAAVRAGDFGVQFDCFLYRFHNANTVVPMKKARAGSSTVSRPAIQAERPTIDRAITSTGVKQQTAVTSVPTIPIANNRFSDIVHQLRSQVKLTEIRHDALICVNNRAFKSCDERTASLQVPPVFMVLGFFQRQFACILFGPGNTFPEL